MARWLDLPIDRPLYRNLDESAVQGYQTAIENGFRNELGGQTRFPGLKDFVDLESEFGDNGKVFLGDFNGDLVAATDKGQVYTIDRSGNVANRTAAPVSGGRRTIMAKSDTEIMFAAGGEIIRLRDDKTELLSEDAPRTTHVGWIDGYTLAAELNSNRWYYSNAAQPATWPALNVYQADGNPDNITAVLVTPFREIMVAGADSIEQFERVPTGTVPFFKRWAIGDGVSVPYAMTFADNATWMVNKQREVVKSYGQTPQAVSAAIGRYLESVDDWSDAWMGGYPDQPLHIQGQKFLVLQMPNATNPYGSKGITLLLDYVKTEWSELYGFDADTGLPAKWPGWSHWTIWDRVFVGGEGRIYEIDTENFQNAGQTQRWLVRTAHFTAGDSVLVTNLRLIVKRGMGGSDTDSQIWVRAARDGKPWGRKVLRSLGKAGDTRMTLEFGGFGDGNTIQFEFGCTDNVQVELVKAQIKIESLGA